MTVFIYLLIIIIPLLLLLLLRKPSIKVNSFAVKLLLLVVPLFLLVAWFVNEGAFSGGYGGGLADLYGSFFIAAFLLCYEIAMFIHYFYLSAKGKNTKENKLFLLIGLLLLFVTVVYFIFTISS